MTGQTAIRHYVYEADLHCRFHAEEQFGREALDNGTAEDSDGNTVSACFTWDECDNPDYCSECLYAEVLQREEEAQRRYEETGRL